MPRQPYHRVSPNTPATGLVMGTYMRGKRSGLELLIGQCIMSWPPVETEMAMILAHLIGAKDAAAMAVFHHLRRQQASLIRQKHCAIRPHLPVGLNFRQEKRHKAAWPVAPRWNGRAIRRKSSAWLFS